MQGISQCPRRSVLTQLWFWVLVAIGAGTLFGIVAPEHAKEAKWLADAFLQLVKTITAPVIFITVVVGIASLGNMARAGGLAARALGYFFGATVVALGLGLLAGNLLHPSGGFAGAPSAAAGEARALRAVPGGRRGRRGADPGRGRRAARHAARLGRAGAAQGPEPDDARPCPLGAARRRRTADRVGGRRPLRPVTCHGAALPRAPRRRGSGRPVDALL
jgi:hypothetical protein